MIRNPKLFVNFKDSGKVAVLELKWDVPESEINLLRLIGEGTAKFFANEGPDVETTAVFAHENEQDMNDNPPINTRSSDGSEA
jgi:hypothetical protein